MVILACFIYMVYNDKWCIYTKNYIRCLVYYLQGDTTKEAQPNDQATNRIVANFFRKSVVR